MTAVDSTATTAVLSLRIPAVGYDRPVHHAYLHPACMARLRLSCNQPVSLTAPTIQSAASSLPSLVHVWPDTCVPVSTVQLHAAAAVAFTLSSCSTVQLTAVTSGGSSFASLPPAVKIHICRWLQPVTIDSKAPDAASTADDKSTDAEVAAAIGRQLWGRAVVPRSFIVTSILSQPQLVYIDSITLASSTAPSSSTAAFITPETAIHCAVTATSPASLVSPPSAATDWPRHVVATFPEEFAVLHQFLTVHAHRFLASASPSPALLVCGGGGTGKSALLSVVGSSVCSVAGGGSLFVRRLTCGEIIASSGMAGEGSSALSEAWSECVRMRQLGRCAVLVVDDVTPLLKTGNFSSVSSQLLTLIDAASSNPAALHSSPQFIAACDDSHPIASHWLRAGRFDEQLHMRTMAATQRQRVLDWLMGRGKVEVSSAQSERVASRMHGCSVRQLVNVWRYARLLRAEETVQRQTYDEVDNGNEISWKQWETAIATVAPLTSSSSLLSPTSATSALTLQPTAADSFPLVGGYKALKKHLLLLITSFLRPPQQQGLTRYALAAFARPTGILLHGLSGCGKSLLLSSLAALSSSPGLTGGALFGVVRLHVTSVLSPYLGESERRLRSVFEQARASAPCLLLVDDMDALLGSRGDGAGGGDEEGGATRLLTTLLVLLDGIDSSQNHPPVLVVATATSPASLDSALLRPGRLSNQLLIPLPTAEDRRDILQSVAAADGVRWGSGKGGVEWQQVMRRTRGCSGAELCGLIRRSVWAAWREQEGRSSERQLQTECVEMRHVLRAMDAIGCCD